jgi:cytochrome c peroxidase
MKALWNLGKSLLLAALSMNAAFAAEPANRQTQLEDLGRALFFDINLSRDRTQSCATCHDPARAFSDWRDSGIGAAASLGGDLHTLGDRNAPTISYAASIPKFSRKPDGDYVGGLFWDGRAATLEEQAGGPPLNPIEMAMPDKAAVVARLQENANYQHAFKGLFGDNIFADSDKAYAAMLEGLAALERTGFFSPYDSKYDRYLRGEYKPTEQEELGITLFFSNQFTNCNKCHMLQRFPGDKDEVFSNFTYQNIGVPANTALRKLNGKGTTFIDHGLLEHTGKDDLAQDGKFRVSTLRNVAITAPYMHNGVFRDLRTVMQFYNKYLTKGTKAQINPETGQKWGEPEVAANLALEKLQAGRSLDNRSIDALIAFMQMLTDKRYEPLLPAANTPATPAGK